jgi:hypothetical protein
MHYSFIKGAPTLGLTSALNLNYPATIISSSPCVRLSVRSATLQFITVQCSRQAHLHSAPGRHYKRFFGHKS